MVASKQYRARTGCLTCRDRHIKCDENVPKCRNCEKSGRECERGIRLNFIDIRTSSRASTDVTPSTNLVFHDESQTIASGYTAVSKDRKSSDSSKSSSPGARQEYGRSLSVSTPRNTSEESTSVSTEPPTLSSRLINDPDEGLLMEIFIEKVAPWMDCLDASKPFTNLISLRALNEPMLYNVIMACAAKYISQGDASSYLDKATAEFQLRVNNPASDVLTCCATSVLLKAYEAMADDPDYVCVSPCSSLLQRLESSGGISGLAGTCYWTNVLTSLVHSLHHNKSPPWNPEDLRVSLDADLPSAGQLSGDEDQWAYRMVYICSKVAALRSDLAHSRYNRSTSSLRDECEQYKSWCDEWANNVPRSMMPLCYILSSEKNPDLVFPHILLVTAAATVARLLYHTTCLLLAQLQPMESAYQSYAQRVQKRHAMDICGITSQAEDKDFCYVAMCCLLIAGESMAESADREEVVQVLERIVRGTPWEEGEVLDKARNRLV